MIDTAPDSAWKVHKKNPDRTFYSLGDGFVVAYHKRITDPSEFALDVLDLVTHRRRAARLWNALAAIPLAVSPGRGRLLLHVVNYGSPIDADVQARVHGHFPRALLHAPGLEKPSVLKVSKRGTMSEVFLPELNRVATIEFLR